jgi:hypothetical protein
MNCKFFMLIKNSDKLIIKSLNNCEKRKTWIAKSRRREKWYQIISEWEADNFLSFYKIKGMNNHFSPTIVGFRQSNPRNWLNSKWSFELEMLTTSSFWIGQSTPLRFSIEYPTQSRLQCVGLNRLFTQTKQKLWMSFSMTWKQNRYPDPFHQMQ